MHKWVDTGAMKPVGVGLTVRAISGMVMGLMIENILGDRRCCAARCPALSRSSSLISLCIILMMVDFISR